MTDLNIDDFKPILETRDTTCISIYLPTEPRASSERSRIRFKSLLRQAEMRFEQISCEEQGFGDLMEKGRQLLSDDAFWRERSEGLAVFISSDGRWSYPLPLAVDESVSVAKHFAIKPLIPLFMTGGRFFILALSLSRVRLFACDRFTVSAVDLPDVPAGIDDTLRFDDKQAQIQFHTGSAAGGGTRPAMYHGQGVGIDERKDEIQRYFKEVDRGLAPHWSPPVIPVVMAGVDYLLPIFREVSDYRWFVPQAVTGNPDALGPDELHARALPLVRPVLMRKQRDAEADYHRRAGLGRTAAGVEAVVPAAAHGRVETLFVAQDHQRMGRFDDTSQRVVRTLGDDDCGTADLLERATLDTLRNGGSVYAIPREAMPDKHAAVAALLRY